MAANDTAAVPEWFAFGRALLAKRAAERIEGEGGDEAAAERAALVAAARLALHQSLGEDRAFSALAANAGLGTDESEVLAVLATVESDLAAGHLAGEIQGLTHGRLTLGGLGLLFGNDHPGPLAAGPDTALRRSAFVEVVSDGPWATQPLILHHGVVWALVGDPSADPDLPADTVWYDHDPTFDSLFEDWTVRNGDGATGIDPSRSDFVVVNGPDRMRRRQLASRHTLGDRLLCAPTPADDKEWAALVREATVTGRGVCIEIADSLPPAGKNWINRARHLVWVVSAASGPSLDELPDRARLEVHAPPIEPSDEEWIAALGAETERTHPLTFDQLQRVRRAHHAVEGDLDAAVRRLASGQLEQLTHRIRPSRKWDDIVVSPDRMELLQSIVDRYRLAKQVYDEWGFSPTPSRGLVALFSGPSGTGKTLAAEIIAGELGLDVFKLDLSSVVSKYIGETEKNLEQIFDAASAGNMVLFFDEADSLFGKRSEVKDARDRYANIEVSYLLQRLETYDGLVIMATNFEKNVDEAFLRRIHVRVAFALPGVKEREAIWRRNLPSTAPVADIDVERLAEHFELSGGAIRNATVQSAFAAAAAGTDITMGCAITGVAREYRKMGRLIQAKDFGEFLPLVAE